MSKVITSYMYSTAPYGMFVVLSGSSHSHFCVVGVSHNSTVRTSGQNKKQGKTTKEWMDAVKEGLKA